MADTDTRPMPEPDMSEREPTDAEMAPGWYWVKTLEDTKRDFWMPACLCADDQRGGPDFWLDAWLDQSIEPTEIGPRISSPDERQSAGKAEPGPTWQGEDA